MTRTELRKLSERLDDAFNAYATDNGDGFGSRDFQGAYEYREEGYALALEASLMPESVRDEHIEAEIDGFDENARYLIRCAADYRLAELGEHRANAAFAERVAA